MKNKIRNIIWVSTGVLIMIVIITASTFISDSTISSGANQTLSGNVYNYSSYDTSIKLYSKDHTTFGNDFGESIELWGLTPVSKAYIGWYSYDNVSQRVRATGWIGCHYNLTNGNTHSHCSWETLDNSTGTPSINTHLEITYGSEKEKVEVKVNSADFIVQDIAVFNRSGRTKITPITSLLIYPGQQSNTGFQISNTSSAEKIDLSVLGSDYIQISDHIEIAGSRLLIIDTNTTSFTCNSTIEGSSYYDGTKHKMYTCNSTCWYEPGKDVCKS